MQSCAMKPNDARRKLGEALARARAATGKTQAEVACDIGTHLQNMSDWERGKYAPRAFMLLALANYYGVSLDALFDRS
jgi:transcriptional regulator with XRE-family HTH domain